MGFSQVGHGFSTAAIGFSQCKVVLKLGGADVKGEICSTYRAA